jgi:AbrB family looped-hinge helix DNA binding protein
MTEQEEPDVVVVSSKGQVVIPIAIRKKLNIGPKTKLLVYGHNDGVIMKKIKGLDSKEELEELYEKIDARITSYGELSEKEINDMIQKHRKNKTGLANLT